MANTPNNDKHAREDEYAAKVIGRERERQEKRKNGLPPFLMVRSGLFNIKDWWPALVMSVVGGASVAVKHENILDYPEWLIVPYFVAFLAMIYWGTYNVDARKESMEQDIRAIQTEFYKYLKFPGYTLDFDKEIQNKKLLRLLTRHEVKYNPGIFDRLIANDKETVKDLDMRSCIIDAGLRTNPDKAVSIINKFEPAELNPDVYAKAKLYAKRYTYDKLRHNEK